MDVRAGFSADVAAGLNHELDDVRRCILDALRRTAMRDYVNRFNGALCGGKMLRSRLVIRLGTATGMMQPIRCQIAAAVEMLHAASVLHDDILDGGTYRRGLPSVWISEGTKMAVLLGDLLVSLAADTVLSVLADRIPLLMRTLREMCDAEASQEFRHANAETSWDACVRIAEGKTGSLFGFAASCSGGDNLVLSQALDRAGRSIGTAYQLADDFLDVSTDSHLAGKTLGTDGQTGKLTAATVKSVDAISATEYVKNLLNEADDALNPWPAVQRAWSQYRQEDMEPLVCRFMASTCAEAAP